MVNKTLTLLGFASKAGKLSFGFSAANESLQSGTAQLIVTAGDVSPKSRKEISYFANTKKIPVITLTETDIQTLSGAVGRRCGILSVNDKGFADAINKEENA